MALFQLIEDLEEGQKIKAGAQINQEDKVGPSLLGEWVRVQWNDPVVSRLWDLNRGRRTVPKE